MPALSGGREGGLTCVVVFARLPARAAAALMREGARFYPWDASRPETPLYRFVCSFATAAHEIETFAIRLKSSLAHP